MAQRSGKGCAAAVGWPQFTKKTGGLTLCLLAITSLWVGCTTVQVRESREASTGAEPGEAVTVIFYSTSGSEARSAEKKLGGCIARAIRKAHPFVQMVPADEFRRTAFPDLDSEAVPRSPESLTLLLNSPVFLERIAPLRLRYLVLVGGITTEQHYKQDSPIWCGGGMGAAGCLGVAIWDKNSRAGAFILDIKRASVAGEVRVTASGHPWIAALLIYPIGLPAFTESRACGELGEAVAKFIASSNRPEP
ncbi:MAG: hypothetical protein HYY20_06015 [Candidatus Tectomicrobia bacterium]|uniref:Uncharacterized protein n=1 Tax=Tectimicrobiota bacterium TaxID=2528274 RepID=A0A932FWE6_UNCTE|nr:hypothetical protein [Candidatus Tectomicrobia bacterium]